VLSGQIGHQHRFVRQTNDFPGRAANHRTPAVALAIAATATADVDVNDQQAGRAGGRHNGTLLFSQPLHADAHRMLAMASSSGLLTSGNTVARGNWQRSAMLMAAFSDHSQTCYVGCPATGRLTIHPDQGPLRRMPNKAHVSANQAGADKRHQAGHGRFAHQSSVCGLSPPNGQWHKQPDRP